MMTSRTNHDNSKARRTTKGDASKKANKAIDTQERTDTVSTCAHDARSMKRSKTKARRRGQRRTTTK